MTATDDGSRRSGPSRREAAAPVELSRVQRRVATRYSRLAYDFGGEEIASEFGIAAQQVFGDPRFGQLLIQLQLKHVELSKTLIDAFRDRRFSATAVLVRPLLEGAVKLLWAAVPASVDDRRKRLLRLLIRAYADLEELGTTLLPGEQALVDEGRALGLRAAPDTRGAMRAVDAAGRQEGLEPFVESHYSQFALSSQHLHVHLDGPAVFREDKQSSELVVFLEPRIGLGFVSLRWSLYYFATATQAIAILLELDDRRDRIVRRYKEIAGEAEEEVQRLLAAGQP